MSPTAVCCINGSQDFITWFIPSSVPRSLGNQIQTSDSEAFRCGVFAQSVAEATKKYARRDDRADGLRQ